MKSRAKTQLLFTHLFSWCLLLAQVSPVIAQEQEAKKDGLTVEKANKLRQENVAHIKYADKNGGHATYCAQDDAAGSFGQYESDKDAYSAYTLSNTQDIQARIAQLNRQGSSLTGAQKDYAVDHGDFVDPSKPIEDRYDKTKKRYSDAQRALNAAATELSMATAELAAAEAKCRSEDERGSFCRLKIAQELVEQEAASVLPVVVTMPLRENMMPLVPLIEFLQ